MEVYVHDKTVKATNRRHGPQQKVLGEVQVRTAHWSDDHRYQLYAAAKRIVRQFPQYDIDIDELVDEGWLRHLRYVLKPCPSDSRALMSVMYKYVVRQYMRFADDEHPSDLPHRDEEIYVAPRENTYDSFQELYDHFFSLIPTKSHDAKPNTREHENQGLRTARRAFKEHFLQQKGRLSIAKGMNITRQAVDYALQRATKHIKSRINMELYA